MTTSPAAPSARPPTLDRRRTSWALWITVTIAVASLPTLTFSPVWIVAFVVPALTFHLLRTSTRLGLPSAIALATLLHIATVLLAQFVEREIAHETALGCSLLPPLTYLAARRRGEDIVWALFLSMCVFLIALILGDPSTWQVWAFLCSGIATLLFESSARAATEAHAWRGSFARPRAAIGGVVSVVLATLIVLALCLRGMEMLAKSSRDQLATARRTGERAVNSSLRVGLDDRFEFGKAGGFFNDLQSDELLRVRAARDTLAPELYLRTTHFDGAGLDRWTLTNPSPDTRIHGHQIAHRGRQVASARVREIDILLTGPVENYMFLPPGTIEVHDVDIVLGDPAEELYTRLADTTTSYSVVYQDRRDAIADRAIDRAFERFTHLPPAVRAERAHFDRVIEAARLGVDDSPLEIAEAIIQTLQADHSYALREPGGPYEDSLLNFLSGDKSGYCMHFASALAICLRLVGVPSRIGVGLYAGNAPRGRDGVIALGSQHAHAWVEVPIDELGWVVFDPTPPSMAGALEAAAELTRLAAARDARIDAATRSRFDEYRWLWIALAFGATLTSIGFALNRRLRVAEPGSTRRLADPAALRQYDALVAQLTRWRPRGRGESLGAWARALATFEHFPTDPVHDAIVAYEEVRFGAREFDAARQAKFATAIAALRDSGRAHLEAARRLDSRVE